MRLKAQADIVSVVIIVIMSLGLISSALMWGLPLIQKQQDTAVSERINKYFDMSNINSLPKKIQSVAIGGGEEIFAEDAGGIWILYTNQQGENNNSLTFSYQSKVEKFAPNMGWIPISTGNPSPQGTLGIDDATVVFGRADKTSGGLINTTYKIWMRELWDTSQGKGYKIVLVNDNGPNRATGKSLKISRVDEPAPDANNNNLIVTKINILLG